MNKLNPEHLHLLLDEPIYILHSDHLKDQEDDVVLAPENSYTKATFEGENKKGILIFVGKGSEDIAEDKGFLFKGLNALNILAEDVALVEEASSLETKEKIKHSRCLNFSGNSSEETVYKLNTNSGIITLNCDRISQIRSSEDLKRRFWQALKTLFQ
jgi:hypothetical protein